MLVLTFGGEMSDHIIKVEKLVKRFGELVAVNDISFTVKPGERLLLLH